MLNQLHHALHDTHPADLKTIKQYAQWLRLRRFVNNTFYLAPQAHWVKGSVQAHWV